MDEEREVRATTPPSDIEAEKAVLGSMMKSRDAVDDVIDILVPEDFYLIEHQEIFRTMYEMARKSIGIDLTTLYSELKSRNTSDMVGGITYISKLMDDAIVFSNAKYYAASVLDKSKMRQLIKEADNIKDSAYSKDMEPEDILDIAEQRIMEIAHKTQKRNYEDINEIIIQDIKEIQELQKNNGKVDAIETGFKKVDEILLGGLHKTDLVILAARPGVGKTAFALNIAEHAASVGNKVMIFSLEMANTQLGNRLLSMTANVPLANIRSGNLTQEDWDSISEAQDSFENVDLAIDESAGITPIEMKNKCRRFKAERGGLDLVIIDYLQLMSMGGYNSDNRVNEISAITRSIKIMAKELDCAVVLLSQLNRAAEQRTGHKPQMSDLRESGSIEQDADVIIFLRRDDYYEDDKEKENEPANVDPSTGLTCQVNIAKHRNGSTGLVTLAWVPRYTKFGNMASGYEAGM